MNTKVIFYEIKNKTFSKKKNWKKSFFVYIRQKKVSYFFGPIIRGLVTGINKRISYSIVTLYGSYLGTSCELVIILTERKSFCLKNLEVSEESKSKRFMLFYVCFE